MRDCDQLFDRQICVENMNSLLIVQIINYTHLGLYFTMYISLIILSKLLFSKVFLLQRRTLKLSLKLARNQRPSTFEGMRTKITQVIQEDDMEAEGDLDIGVEKVTDTMLSKSRKPKIHNCNERKLKPDFKNTKEFTKYIITVFVVYSIVGALVVILNLFNSLFGFIWLQLRDEFKPKRGNEFFFLESKKNLQKNP